MKEDKLIQDWLDQNTSTDELVQLEKVIAYTEKLDIPSRTNKEEAWKNLLENINQESSDNHKILIPERKTDRRWIVWVASIAALFVLGYFGLMDSPEPTIYTTELASTITHSLPDDSKVMLNASSSVSFIEEKWENERMLSLSGEAFFEVNSGSKFTVVTDIGKVSVLGTSFNVFARDNTLQVSTFTGKVKVEKGEQNIILLPGDQLTLNTEKNLWNVNSFNLNQTATWRIGSFYFDLTPLQKVIDELERQFAIEIKVSTDISQRFYSGYFSKSDLTEALQLVFYPMGFNFSVDGNQVNIQ